MPDAKRPKHNWLAIRTAYVVKGWTPEHIGKEFGVHITTVKKRASKEGWTAERHRNATSAAEVASEVAAEAARQLALNAGKEKALTDLQIADTLRALINDSITDLKAIDDLGSKIVARNQIMLMGQRFLTVNRIVRGIVPGQPSDTGELDNPGAIATPTGTDEMEGDTTAAPMRRFVVKIHQPAALVAVPDQQAAG